MYKTLFFILFILLFQGCSNTQEGVIHNQGQDCVSCHGDNGTDAKAKEEKTFNAGGTLFSTQDAPDKNLGALLQNYTVRLTKTGSTIEFIQGKGQGNFYTTSTITANDYKAQILNDSGSVLLESSATHGQDRASCNSCHTSSGANGTSGRVYTPNQGTTLAGTLHNQGQACANCHAIGGSNSTQFNVGGTLFSDKNSSDNILGALLGNYTVRFSNGDENITFIQGNGQGNFYSTRTNITDNNYTAQVLNANGTVLLASGADHGANRSNCNSCHTTGGSSGTSGRVYTPVSFETVVYPILFTNCKGCHLPGNESYEVSTSISSTYASAHNYVNTTTPSSSYLVVNPTGGHSHNTIFSSTDTKYTTILRWIEEGALEN